MCSPANRWICACTVAIGTPGKMRQRVVRMSALDQSWNARRAHLTDIEGTRGKRCGCAPVSRMTRERHHRWPDRRRRCGTCHPEAAYRDVVPHHRKLIRTHTLQCVGDVVDRVV